jgi:hypothetical protein
MAHRTVTASPGGMVGWGQWRWAVVLTPKLDILRLTTRDWLRRHAAAVYPPAVWLPAGPERPRQAAGVRVEPDEAVLVAQLFDGICNRGRPCTGSPSG